MRDLHELNHVPMETSHKSCLKEDFEVYWNYCQSSLLSILEIYSRSQFTRCKHVLFDLPTELLPGSFPI